MIFVFGRTPDLSYLELSTLIPDASRLLPNVAETSTDISPDFIDTLGGTIKIAVEVARIDSADENALLPILIPMATGRSLTFGVSTYGGKKDPKLAPKIKALLSDRGYSARYVESHDSESISSVVIEKQDVTELLLVWSKEIWIVAKTVAVQDFESWNNRDFGRPYANAKAGMLPPKVARMIVNIAMGYGAKTGMTRMLLDPFCGVGTILAEGLLSGSNVTGSDISAKAVDNAKKNIEWVRKNYPLVTPFYSNIFVADATHISDHLAPNSIDAIATEPYLGEPIGQQEKSHVTYDGIKNILKGLEKLYVGSLREWGKVLKPGGRVVMAMPQYVTKRVSLSVKNVVDRCESLGYTLLAGPIEYSRPQAIVKRQFYIFKKN